MDKQVTSFEILSDAQEEIVIKSIPIRHGIPIEANFKGDLSDHFHNISNIIGHYG